MSALSIDTSSSAPASEQLRGQLVERIGSGALAGGTRLPTVRGLADELGVAPGTVAKVYRELERDGLIETRGRSGSFVTPQGDAAARAAQEAATEYVDRVLRLGVSADDAQRYVELALRSR